MKCIHALVLTVFVGICLCCATVGWAVPANSDAVLHFQQPDGTLFTAHLIGDETVHWYETEDGYTVLKDRDGTWVYAQRREDGGLMPSAQVVGKDSPLSGRHLRQDRSLLAAQVDKATERRSQLPMATQASITGTQDAVIILVEFADTGAGEGSGGSHDAAYFGSSTDGIVLGSSGGNLADYLDEVSYGQLALTGIVANNMWHRTNQTELYYGQDSDPGQVCDSPFDVPTSTDNTNVCIYELVRNAVQMADSSGFDFSPYDHDGDGIVDHVIVVHAGQDQAALGGDADDIWSHWGVIPGGGEPVDGVAVENYVMVSEWDAMSVYAHEFMHDLGAPDLYDYDGDSQPVGRWSNMAYNFETPRPPHTCGLLEVDIDADFSNGMTGWITPVPMDADSTYTVNRLDQNQNGSVFISEAPFSGNEYFLVENRSTAGYYDYSVPESGLVITHVDMDMPNGAGRFNDGPPANSYHGAWVERPLDVASPDGAAFSLDDGETEFTPTTLPNTNANGGVGTGQKFYGMSAEGDVMTFDFKHGPTNVTGATSGSTRWDLAGSPYVVSGTLTISDGDSLLIDPGVVVKFKTDGKMVVNGTLVAAGAEGDTIAFTAWTDDDWGGDTNQDGVSTGSRGYWHDIEFNGADAGCLLDYCVVRYAGKNHDYNGYTHYHALDIRGSGSALTLSHSIIEQTYGSNRYSWYRPWAIHSESGTNLLVSDSIIRDNSYDGFWCEGNLNISDSTISGNGRYGLQSYGPLTVTRTHFEDNTSTALYSLGADPVIQNSTFLGNSSTAMYITGANPHVVADTCRFNLHGIILATGVIPAEFHSSFCDSNDYADYIVPVRDVDNVWLNNALPVGGTIGYRADNLQDSTQWVDDYTYVAWGDLTIPHDLSLTIEPGAIFKFNSGYKIITDGQLVVNGNLGDETIFTSYRDDSFGGDTNADGATDGVPGDWKGLVFNTTNPGCSLQYCRFRYAGQDDGGYRRAVVANSGAQLVMANCEVDQTAGGGSYPYAVQINSGSAAVLSDCLVHNNIGDGIYINEPSTQVTGCLAKSNTRYGFYVHPDLVGEIATTDSLESNGHTNNIAILGGHITVDDAWPATYGYLFNGTVTIDPGATLILYKGDVLKFNGNRSLIVNGGIYAQGDAVDKVVLTSYKDDNYGGDTNEDLGNSVPAPGDWGQVHLDNATSGLLEWVILGYGGYGSTPALQIDACTPTISSCIIHDNLDRGIRVGSSSGLAVEHSDIYGNGFGLENLDGGNQVDARGCWWGDATGPSGVGSGTGDAVSSYVDYSEYLDRSIDNPWVVFTSPAVSGDYNDALVFDLDGDPLPDLIAATQAGGLEVYHRDGFESWSPAASPLTEGQYLDLEKGDLNDDGHDDFLAAGADGIHCFIGDGAGTLTEVSAPLVGLIAGDAKFAYLDHDQYLDIVACSNNNGGIWVFYGDGAGNWTSGNRPVVTGTFNKIEVADLNNDTYSDIITTSGEYHGIQTWYGASDDTWTPGTTIEDGKAFFGLAVGDIDKDGFYDVAAGYLDVATGITMYLNDGAGGWNSLAGPVTSGLFNDLALADLNGDTRLDLAAANQSGGIKVWVGTSTLAWNFWYHPAAVNTYRSITIDDFSLNGSPDLVACAEYYGMALWDNLAPSGYQEYFSIDPDVIDFGQVAMGSCAHADFELTNVTSADTLRNVVVYTTNPAFTVAAVAKDVGPLDLLPGETKTIRVTYCPTEAVAENEVVIVRSTQSVTHMRVTGQGVDYIAPLWAIDLAVANAVGGAAGCDTLTFGAAIGATDSLDVQSGESGLPPVPPSDIFDARFLIPGTEGSLVNIHDYYNITDAFDFKWQPGADGYPMTITWDPGSLPSGTFLIGTALKDTLNMALNSQYVIPAGMEYITQLTVWSTILSSHTYDLNQGWQLVSRPVTTDSDSLSVLFPTALSAFGFDGSYQQADLLAAGKGYWLDMPADSTAVHTGNQVRKVQVSLPAGWNLIGAPYDTFLVADITQNPPGCIQSVYGFNVGYFQADRLYPGQGYWVDLAQPCELTLDMDTFKSMPTFAKDQDVDSGVPALASTPLDWSLQLDLQPDGMQAGRTQSLVIGGARGATSGIDPALGEREVPPLPPSGVFDARLVGAGGNGLLCDLRDAAEEKVTFNLALQGDASCYPVTVSWDPRLIPGNWQAVLGDAVTGTMLPPVDMHDRSEVAVTEAIARAGGLKVTISLTGVETGVPSVLMLYPNTPNPFNPSTLIRYDLPRDSRVNLQIFDLAGRLVRTLVADQVKAGHHQELWDGRDDTGSPVASGSYFSRLVTEDKVMTHKMLLVK